MRTKITFAVLFLFFISVSAVYAYSPKAPGIAGRVLNPTSSGYKEISLKNVNKKIIILNFFATWCPPCRAEIPDLERFYKENRKNVLIIGINVNLTTSGVKSFLKKRGITYPVVHANFLELQDYGGINDIPQSFFINNYHHILFRWAGGLTPGLLNTVVDKMLSIQLNY